MRSTELPFEAAADYHRRNTAGGSLVGAPRRCRVSHTKPSPSVPFDTSGTTGCCGSVERRRCWGVAFQYNRCLVGGVRLVQLSGPFDPAISKSLAYVYCVRSFGVSTLTSLPSHDQPACQGLVTKLVPFLMDRSTLLLRSVDEARSSVQSRLNDKVRPPGLHIRD
jgi:hypothetical protein